MGKALTTGERTLAAMLVELRQAWIEQRRECGKREDRNPHT